MSAVPAMKAEPTIFSTVLKPYRSLSPNGFALVMIGFAACAFALGFIFWLKGAWPVVGFCGLDILALQFAFRMNYRAARAEEEIRLTRERLTVRQIAPNGRETETGFNPYWARLEVDRDREARVMRVRIASHGSRLDVARFLGPREREKFADQLSAALARVRMAPAG
jgi:uncharacterized membrane protein